MELRSLALIVSGSHYVPPNFTDKVVSSITRLPGLSMFIVKVIVFSSKE